MTSPNSSVKNRGIAEPSRWQRIKQKLSGWLSGGENKKIRKDLLVLAFSIQVIWCLLFVNWLSFIMATQLWVFFVSFWGYYVVAAIFVLFAITEYIVIHIAYTALKGENLIPFTISITINDKKETTQ